MPYKDHSRNIEAINRVVRRNIAYAKKVKTERGCAKCGTTETVVLDFHHRDPSDKRMAISRLVRSGRSIEAIDKEIAKCDVLCANCHRRMHGED